MSFDENDVDVKEKKEKKLEIKKLYNPPSLKHYGTVLELTKMEAGSGLDGGSHFP